MKTLDVDLFLITSSALTTFETPQKKNISIQQKKSPTSVLDITSLEENTSPPDTNTTTSNPINKLSKQQTFARLTDKTVLTSKNTIEEKGPPPKYTESLSPLDKSNPPSSNSNSSRPKIITHITLPPKPKTTKSPPLSTLPIQTPKSKSLNTAPPIIRPSHHTKPSSGKKLPPVPIDSYLNVLQNICRNKTVAIDFYEYSRHELSHFYHTTTEELNEIFNDIPTLTLQHDKLAINNLRCFCRFNNIHDLSEWSDKITFNSLQMNVTEIFKKGKMYRADYYGNKYTPPPLPQQSPQPKSYDTEETYQPSPKNNNFPPPLPKHHYVSSDSDEDTPRISHNHQPSSPNFNLTIHQTYHDSPNSPNSNHSQNSTYSPTSDIDIFNHDFEDQHNLAYYDGMEQQLHMTPYNEHDLDMAYGQGRHDEYNYLHNGREN